MLLFRIHCGLQAGTQDSGNSAQVSTTPSRLAITLWWNNSFSVFVERLLVDDLRYHEQPIRTGRGVPEGFFVGEAGPDFVGAGHIDEGKSVGGRFDVADIDFFEFFNVAENVPQLGANFLLFFGS